MDGVYITKTGFRATQWNGEIRQYVDKPIHCVLHELRSACQIEDGVTLGDIIRLVACDPLLAALIGEYSWCDVRAFYAEVNKPPATKSDLAWIEISAKIEFEKPYKQELGDIHLSLDVSGRDGTDQRWAIEFTPVNEMAHVPVKLNTTIEVHDWRNWESRPDHSLKVDEGRYCFSLLEVLSEIFYEISFCGSPEERNEKLGELLDAKAEIESGEAKLVPFNP